MSRNFLFVDGSNLNAGQQEAFGLNSYLDFTRFIKCLERQMKIGFLKVFFYASYSPKHKRPTKKQKLYLANEGLFYKSVRSLSKCVFFKGHRSKTSEKEKGVDVKLAVDMVHLSHLDQFDDLYLFSGDADFMHALHISRKLGKKVFVIALQNRIPMRFTYDYKTFIAVFDSKLQKLIKPAKGQKITTVLIERKWVEIKI